MHASCIARDLMKRPLVAVDAGLLVAYRQMSEDETREAEARDWIEGLMEDAAPPAMGSSPSQR
jgi:hypothetical protein